MLRLLEHALEDLLHHELDSHAPSDRSRVQQLDERAWQQEVSDAGGVGVR